ncbi:MAG: hypothetical protein AABW88_03250 [Nanoarchaeota archaeon]
MTQTPRIKKLEKAINKLKERIIKHRRKCKSLHLGNPCFNCHINTLTKIEKALQEMSIYETLEMEIIKIFKNRNRIVEEIVVSDNATVYTIKVKR